MKKLLTKIAIIIFIVDTHPSMLFAQPDSATGKIYFMGNPKGQPFESYGVFVDSKHLCDLNERHYFVYNLPVGKHFISMQKNQNKSNELAINVGGAQSYYIQFYYSQGGYSEIDLVAQRIHEDLAKLILPSLKPDTHCEEKIAKLDSNQH